MFLMMPVCVYLVKKFRVNVNADEDKGALLRSLLLISQNGKHKGVWKLRSLVHHQKLRMNVNVDNDKGALFRSLLLILQNAKHQGV